MRLSRSQRHKAQARLPGQCLILVGPEGRGKDLIVASARRRFRADASLDFPQRIATRNSGDNDEHACVSRAAFRDLERSGGLFASWSLGGHSFGLAGTAAVAVAEGRTVVFAATEEAAVELARRGERVHLVEVAAGPDAVRARAALATPVIERAAQRAECGAAVFLRRQVLQHGGDVAEAVRAFHALILETRTERLGRDAAVLPVQPGSLKGARARLGVPARSSGGSGAFALLTGSR